MDNSNLSYDTTPETKGFWERNRLITKGVFITILTLFLLIPQFFIANLIHERKSRQQEVIEELSGKWAGDQTVAGPIIVLPFWQSYKNDKGQISEYKDYAYFMPDQLSINGEILPDIRLGRRWNLDPVKKPHLSGYLCFSDNPNIFVDPNGDTDYFNTKGEFIKRVYDGKAVIRVAFDNDLKYTLLLSQISTRTPESRFAIATIVGHYATQIGISYSGHGKPNTNGRVGIGVCRDDDGNKDESVQGYTIGKNIYINYNGEATMPKKLDNYNNLMNTLRHEKDHKEDNLANSNDNPNNNVNTNSFIRHAQIYMNEMNGPEFSKLSKEVQFSTIMGAAKRILQASVGTSETPQEGLSEVEQAQNSLIKSAKKFGFNVTFGHTGASSTTNYVNVSNGSIEGKANYDPNFKNTAH